MESDACRFFSSTVKLRPRDLGELRGRMDRFTEAARQSGRPVALVTSGGTTVPLETNTVRFIDNFSSGTRGAQCTEEFLKAGYAVLLLYRKGSSFPFLTNIVQQLNNDPLKLIGSVQVQTACAEKLDESLLPIGFTTIFEYLFLLREACQSIQVVGRHAIVFLAAAVSDFYVPESEMATEKIQSRAHDGLTIQLRNVPKLLGSIKHWAPEALVISFKLETNPNILLAKAAGAIVKYTVDAVCSNLLHNYRDLVTVIWRDPQKPGIEIGAKEIVGEETEPIPVQGVESKRIERGSHVSIDVPLVQTVVAKHKLQCGRGAVAAAGSEGHSLEPPEKRRKASDTV
mmetsp:Transcript_140072/g.390444  ORF Transcript_140072/g.390444 Transcript_140072/m.390444 type:complete len:342 (-) Transcript_140072:80-1105(-)